MTKTLIFPTKILEQHLVVLGKTGAGKSSALRHIVEHLLSHKKRVCIIDPKGDWNGLKVSADGQGPGYPAILFGNFKETAGQSIPADVPLNEYSGKHIAELVTSGNRPCVVGFRGWTMGDMHRFWIDFAATIFNSNEGELYLVIDEVHNFAPKGKIMSPEVGKCLHWANRIMNEGRGIGLVNLIASQRPQKVHNDTLTACETLVAMRVIHKADRDAVEDWIKGCGDPKKGTEVLNSLASMSRGEAFVWSPEVDFGPTRLAFPMFTTFDSFAPPQLQKKVSGKDWSTVDLAEVRTKLASVIERAKATDPNELRKRILELEADVRRLSSARTQQLDQRTINSEVERQVEIAVAEVEKRYEALEAKYEEALDELRDRLRQITELASLSIPVKPSKPVARTLQPRSVQSASPPDLSRRIQSPPPQSNVAGEKLPPGEKATLIAAAQYPEGVTREQCSILTGYKRSSRDAYIARLSGKGYVDARGPLVFVTESGIDALGSDYEPLPTGEALQEYWINRLPPGERAVLEAAIAAYPQSLRRESLEETTGYKRSSRDAYIARLSARRLIQAVGAGEVRASDQLFGD
jgi:energy-coupling factor transporter ATP-binding protein EcfA2